MSRVLLSNGKTFEVPPDVTLLEAAQHAGFALPHSCRSGRCGSCKAKGSAKARHLQGEDCLSAAERQQGWLLTCTDTVDADISLELDDLAELATLKTLTLPARVAHIERPLPDLLRLHLRLPPNHGLRFLAGQYLELIGPNGVRRAYSMANADAAQGIELHIRRVVGGAMSEFLFERLQLEALLRIQAPRGSFHLGEVAGLHLTWLATGTGIAPFKAMLEALAARPRAAWPASITLLWGNRQPAEHYWRPPPGELPLRFLPVCSRASGWGGLEGHVQQHAPAQVDRVHACGAPAMIESSRALYQLRGLPNRHFHADAFVASTGSSS